MQNFLFKEKRAFSKFEAWLYLLMNANHTDTKVLLGNQLIDVKKGSFITSEVKLMAEFSWSKSKLRTFLSLLESQSMIEKVTDSKKTILSLKWAATEMNRRYDTLEAESVRDIDSYHKKLAAGKVTTKDGGDPERMPYIVIVIDELADIMQAYPRELEAAIVRLAQMSRAVGIHLILSTQRPEVNVITGLIKANVPSRIALRVPTQIDSRTTSTVLVLRNSSDKEICLLLWVKTKPSASRVPTLVKMRSKGW